MIPEITVKALKSKLDAGQTPTIVDVREGMEVALGSICTLHIPLGDLPYRYEELLGDDPQREIVVVCRSGNRSASATMFLQQCGYRNVHNLRGGMMAWRSEVDPAVVVG
jgi:rhodanese-related sulfurtransferase